MRVSAVLLAADAGGPDGPVAMWLLGGVPLVAHAAGQLLSAGAVDELIVVGPPGAGRQVRRLLAAQLPGHPPIVVEGGSTRHGSLHAGLAVLDRRTETVVLHDGCRPLAPADVLLRVLRAIRGGAGAVVPTIEVTETVKELDSAGWITGTVPRESLRRMQTPRAVRRELIEAAHARCPPDVPSADRPGADRLGGDRRSADRPGAGAPGAERPTADVPDHDRRGGDEVGALVPFGQPIVAVAGDDRGFAIGSAADLAFAEAVLADRRADAH